MTRDGGRLMSDERERQLLDDARAEEVWRRFERRRTLPFRRLERAWLQLGDAAVGPILRWLSRR